MSFNILSPVNAAENSFHFSSRSSPPDDNPAELSPRFAVRFPWKKQKESSRQQQILEAGSMAVASIDEKYGARRSLEARKAARAMMTEGEQTTVETSKEALDKLQEEMEAQAREAQAKAAGEEEAQAEAAEEKRREEKRREEKTATDKEGEEHAPAGTGTEVADSLPEHGAPLPVQAIPPAMPSVVGTQSALPSVNPPAYAAAIPLYGSSGESSHGVAPVGDVVNRLI